MAARHGAERAHVGRVGACAATLLAAGLALVLGACAPAPERGATHRALRHTADSLVSSGRPELARDRLLAVADGRAAPAAAGWEREWARDRAADLGGLATLDADARGELAATAWPLPSAARDDDPPDWQPRLRALERQLEVRRRRLPPGSLDLAETLTALALLERTKGDGAQAMAHHREALRIRVAALGEDAPEVGESRLALSRELRATGATPSEIGALMHRALEIRRRCFGERSREYAEALTAVANKERWSRRPAAALAAFEELLALRRRLDGPRSRAVADVLADMAVTHMSDGDDRAITRLAGEAVSIYRESGGTPDASESLALNMYGLGLRRVGRLAEADRVLRRTIEVQELRRRGAPDDDVVRGRFHRLAAYGDLALVQLLEGDSLAAWETQERGNARRWLERVIARGELDTTGAWNDLLARVQAKLTDSSAVVGWLDPGVQPGRHGSPYWGYVIRRTGRVHWVNLDTGNHEAGDSIRERFLKLHRRFGGAALWPVRITRWDEVDEGCHECWGLRFAALEPWLAGVRELVVVSPQLNFGVPLEVLRDAQGRPLNERFAIAYEYSALRFVSAPPPQRSRRLERDWRGLLVSAPGGTGGAAGRNTLRWADREVAMVRDRLTAPLVLTGDQASEARWRQLADSGELARFDLLHIASHARSADAFGSEIWLALAEARAPGAGPPLPAERDGLLTFTDFGRWTTRARLVTLSSCWSGGRASLQSEGAIGLGQAFVHAGARSVVCTVWPVDDAASRHFMQYFYAALFRQGPRPCSIAEALREARTRLRDHRAEDGSRPYAHPMYWGAFVLLGDAG